MRNICCRSESVLQGRGADAWFPSQSLLASLLEDRQSDVLAGNNTNLLYMYDPPWTSLYREVYIGVHGPATDVSRSPWTRNGRL